MSADRNRRYLPTFMQGSGLAHCRRVCSYTQETGTCRRLATSWTVSRRFSSLFSASVAPFADSMGGGANISLGKVVSGNDGAFPCDSFDVLLEMKSVRRTARREECCLEDALFSGLSNWVGRGFIFVTQSSYERLLPRGGGSFFSLPHRWCIPTCITDSFLRLLHTGKTRPRVARGGLERPHEVLASRRGPKTGSLQTSRVFCPWSKSTVSS